MNNLISFLNSSYQIPKSLFSKGIMCGDPYSLPIKWQPYHWQRVCQKLKLSSHVVAVVIGRHVCSVARLPLTRVMFRLKNGKSLTQASSLLRWLRAQSEVGTPNQTSFLTAHWGETQTMWHTWIAMWHAWIESLYVKPSRSVYAP